MHEVHLFELDLTWIYVIFIRGVYLYILWRFKSLKALMFIKNVLFIDIFQQWKILSLKIRRRNNIYCFIISLRAKKLKSKLSHKYTPKKPNLQPKQMKFMHAKLTQKPLDQIGTKKSARCALCKFFLVAKLFHRLNK